MSVEAGPMGARITDEMVERARSIVGLRFAPMPWNTVATKDNIKHWCYGVADTNPLFLNERYARGTRWESNIAPPLFTSSFSAGTAYPPDTRYDLPADKRGCNFPGIGEMQLSDEWQFHRVVMLNDRVRSERVLSDLREVNTRSFGRAFIQVWQTSYYAEDGGLVATEESQHLRFERAAGQGRNRFGDLKKYSYTQEELSKIEESYLQEMVRGGHPRFWQDVRVGDALGHVTKGPLTTTEVATFLVGWGGPLMLTDEIAHMYLRDHPAGFITDPITNAPDTAMRQHWDDDFARAMGFPAAFDVGMERVGWFDHLLNNWKGDDAITKRLSVELLEPNFIADTTWITGRVVRKYLEEKDAVVDVELTGIDQRHRTHSRGTATISLPTRGKPSRRDVASLYGDA